MNDDVKPSAPTPRMRLGLKIALVSAGLAAGAVGATAIAASATSTGSTTSSSTPSSSAPATPGHESGHGRDGRGGSAPVRSDEKSLSAAQTATLKAAALKAVPGGTVYRVESDAGDGTYEAHMTKKDGSLVTVKFAKDLTVTNVEAGMGAGDPGPHH